MDCPACTAELQIISADHPLCAMVHQQHNRRDVGYNPLQCHRLSGAWKFRSAGVY